ncbi:hypothetical protein ASG90_15665 [Nocardioides sp. Soil797]|nr:hypothetical protein ASG90_15665 [Nocardioides sp. Soil797]
MGAVIVGLVVVVLGVIFVGAWLEGRRSKRQMEAGEQQPRRFFNRATAMGQRQGTIEAEQASNRTQFPGPM